MPLRILLEEGNLSVCLVMIRNALLPCIIRGPFASASPAPAGTPAYHRLEGEMAGTSIKTAKDSEGKSLAKGSGNSNGSEEGSASEYSGPYVPGGGCGWTMGRGQYNRKPADFVTGAIDEVRFSDAALSLSEFLYAAKSIRGRSFPCLIFNDGKCVP